MRQRNTLRPQFAGVILILLALTALALRGGAAPGGPQRRDIIGGHDTDTNELPFVVRIEGLYFGSRRLRCTGSIVNSRYVLTAAHCVYNPYNGAKSATVYYGHEMWYTDDVIPHSRYNPVTYENDLALLEIASREGVSAPNIEIAQSGHEPLEAAQISGWGVTDATDLSSIPFRLQRATISVKTPETCRELYGTFAPDGTQKFPDSTLCGGAAAVRGGPGDSGSPLFQETEAGFVLVGVHSHRWPQEGPYQTTVYIRTASFRTWILENACAAHEDGICTVVTPPEPGLRMQFTNAFPGTCRVSYQTPEGAQRVTMYDSRPKEALLLATEMYPTLDYSRPKLHTYLRVDCDAPPTPTTPVP